MIFVSASVFFLILLFDFAEITRKFPISRLSETLFVIKLSLLRTPSTFGEILHYIYFVTATFSLWSLCKSNQMTILKSSGHSPQQILYPFMSFALLAALIWLLMLHPVGLYCEKLYHQRTGGDVVTADPAEINRDVWVDCSGSNEIIFMKSIRENSMEGISIFNTKDGRRTFARRATVKEGSWILENVALVNGDKTENYDVLRMCSRVSLELMQLLLKSPQKQNIYHLSRIYGIQAKDRVALKFYELEFHKLLANCATFLLFSLLAAVICFPINHYKTKTDVAVKVIATSVLLRFANNILESLARAGLMSMPLACWAVVGSLFCAAVALLIWREA
jgi:lipopolysaccharide export system permease protein